jgi:hypothetical protein
VTALGSQRRPPRRRTEVLLQDLDLLLEELNLHGTVADLGLQVANEAVSVLGLAGSEPRLHGDEGLVTPFGELAGSDAALAAEGALCRGFFMVSRVVPSSPDGVSQETVQRTTGLAAGRAP